jgi:hypothetical protein
MNAIDRREHLCRTDLAGWLDKKNERVSSARQFLWPGRGEILRFSQQCEIALSR